MKFHAQLAKFVFNETTDEEEILVKQELLETPFWIVVKDYIHNSKMEHGFKRSQDYLDWVSKEAETNFNLKQNRQIPVASLN